MAISFELFSKDPETFAFNALDGQGEIILFGSEYASKEETEQAIKDVQVGSMMSQNIAVGDDPEGRKFFVIKNQAGDVLVKSILFSNELDFNQTLHTVRDSACIAETKDLTN